MKQTVWIVGGKGDLERREIFIEIWIGIEQTQNESISILRRVLCEDEIDSYCAERILYGLKHGQCFGLQGKIPALNNGHGPIEYEWQILKCELALPSEQEICKVFNQLPVVRDAVIRRLQKGQIT